jgi:hypothetical protein
MIKVAVTFNGKSTSKARHFVKAYVADVCTHSNLIIAANIVATKESRIFYCLQPLTEISIRNLPQSKRQPTARKAYFTAICEPIV